MVSLLVLVFHLILLLSCKYFACFICFFFSFPFSKFSRFCFKFSKAKIHSPLVSELFSTLEDFVGKPDADGGEYYIMGDFNCNMLPASFYNANTQALLNITDIYNLKQLITEPTRITPLSSTLIDVIFTNLPDNTTCSGVSHIGISDHRLIVVYRKISSPPVIKGTSTITYYAGQTESEIRPRTMSSVFIGACGFVDWETGHE